MLDRSWIPIAIVLILLTPGYGTAMTGVAPAPAGPGGGEGPSLALGTPSPLDLGSGRPSFVENLGQFDDDDVLLYASLSSGGIAFKAGSVLINQRTHATDGGPGAAALASPSDPSLMSKYRKLLQGEVTGCTLEFTFQGSNDVVPRGEGALLGTHNYILGGTGAGVMTGARTFSRVVYEDLYDGIDLVYLVSGDGLKYEFWVAPGADPSRISVRVAGHDGLHMDGRDLVTVTGVADLRDTGLHVFYADGAGERLPSTFQVTGRDTYGFAVQDRDPARAMVIDPLVFSTYLGTSDWESAGDMLVDDEGHVYVTGYSDGDDFPTTPGAYQEENKNFPDVFVMKMEPFGTSMVWSTFIGGTDAEAGKGLAIDATGAVYVCGYTHSDNYPTTPGAFQNRTFGHGDAFVSKLSHDGTRLLASTILGGFWEDFAPSIAVDGSGNMYVTGATSSTDFPTTPGAFDVAFNDTEAFLTKVNRTATGLVYSTFLGGSMRDGGNAVLVDGNGSAYVAGITLSNDFPTTAGARQPRSAGSADGFVAKVDANGTGLEASTYLGGQWFDEAMGVAMDAGGDVHVFGNTRSDDFPVTAGAFQTTISTVREDDDAFVTRMSWNLSSIRTSTFIGGDAEDYCPDGTLDVDGNVVIGGYTSSTDFPVTDGAYQTQKSAFDDAFVTKLSADYSQLLYSSHIGSIESDVGVTVGVFGNMSIYLAGETFSDTFPTTPGAFQTRAAGNRDLFVSMFTQDLFPPVAVTGPDVVVDQHETVQFDGSGSHDNIGILNWTWSFEYDGSSVELYGPTPSWTFDDAGVYAVTLKVADTSLHRAEAVMNVTVRDITPPVAEAGLSRTIRQGDTVQFDGSGSTDNMAVANWTWTFDYYGRIVTLNGTLAEFTFDRAGLFNVTLTVQDAVGLSGHDWLTIDVVDLTDPIANAGEDVHVDQHQPAELNGSLSSDTTALVNWTWTFVDGGMPVVVYGEVTHYTFVVAGTYEVVLKVFDDAGNFAIDTVTVHVRDVTPPETNAGDDILIDQGGTARFDASLSSDNVAIVSYAWSFEYDGQPVLLEGVSPTQAFDLPGTYLVTLVVTDAEANSAEDTLTVTVRDTANPTAEAGDDLVVDEDVPVAFDGSSSVDNVGIASWTWTFLVAGVTQTLEGKEPAFTFSIPGTYDVTLTVADAAGNTATDHVLVTVRDLTAPQANAGPDRTVDQGAQVALDASLSSDNVGIASYLWSFVEDGSTVNLSGMVQDRIFVIPGTYQVSLTVTDAAGNEGTGGFVLRVKDTVSPIASGRLEREVSLGDAILLDASGSSDNVGIVRWTWTLRDGDDTVTLEGERVSYVFKETGEHEVTLTVEDADGNRGTADMTVTVNGNGWLFLVIALIVLVLVASTIFLARRRGGGTAPGDE